MCLMWRKNIDLLSNVPLLALSVNEKTVAHLLRYFQKGRAEGKEEGGSTYLVVFHWRSHESQNKLTFFSRFLPPSFYNAL